MSDRLEKLISDIVNDYRKLVRTKHPMLASAWPIATGYNVKAGGIGRDIAIVYKHSGTTGMVTTETLGGDLAQVVGEHGINDRNREVIRRKLTRHFGLNDRDGVVLLTLVQTSPTEGHLDPTEELSKLLKQHEMTMGVSPSRVFLSHKGANKPLVRDFDATLKQLGFDTWLDEDAMTAGTNLNRGILQGIEDSCAVVFFITPQFVDESYLATEIDYAVEQKRKKGDRFAIITLAFEENGKVGVVPPLLTPFVYKTPASQLSALREIVRALPLALGNVHWR